MFRNLFANVRAKSPLVHNITNYVTVNDCANIVLACGASPIMADDAAEVEDITSLCAGLNLNIGTLNSRTIPLEAAAAAVCAMGLAGEAAHSRLSRLGGNATYRNYIIDAIFNMTPEQLEEGARYEMR